MDLYETTKFARQRKKIKQNEEKTALKQAVLHILEHPSSGKKLKGEFSVLRSFAYTVKGQSKRLIYKLETERIILFSFGPREGIYK